jgi:WD40 repeat protein
MASSNGRILLWGPGREMMLESTGIEIGDLISSSNGSRLAGSTKDGHVEIWYSDVKGNLIPGPVEVGDFDDRPISRFSFTPNGDGLLTSSSLGILHWELNIDHLLKIACRVAGRNLTEREWKEYIPSEPYQEREPCPDSLKAFD